MKKIVMAIMLMGLVATSYGNVQVDWTASAGFYWSADSSSLLVDGAGGSTIAQLMYSADGTQDAVLTLAGIDTTGAGTGDDVIWASYLITENGIAGDFDEYASFPALQNYSQAFVTGNVYAMIFQDSAIDGNDWYFYTPMIALSDITGILTPQYIEMNTDTVAGNAIDADPGVAGYGVGQVIPEPATVLLFGIGGIGAWLLRRRQQA